MAAEKVGFIVEEILRECDEEIMAGLEQSIRVIHLSGHRFSDKESAIKNFITVLLPAYLKTIDENPSIHATRTSFSSARDGDLDSYDSALQYVAKCLLDSLNSIDPEDLPKPRQYNVRDGDELQKQVEQLLKSRLRSNPSEYFVFVLENLEELLGKKYVERLFDTLDYLRLRETGPWTRFFLMTSRECEAFHLHYGDGGSNFLGEGFTVNVGAYNPQQSIGLLKKHIGIEDETVLHCLHTLVGGCPILLRDTANRFKVDLKATRRGGAGSVSEAAELAATIEQFLEDNQSLATCCVREQLYRVARFLDNAGLWDTLEKFRDQECISASSLSGTEVQKMDILEKIGLIEQRSGSGGRNKCLSAQIWKLLFDCPHADKSISLRNSE